jgi:hypothetical protein
MTQKRQKLDIHSFQDFWTNEYGFIQQKNRAVFASCCETVVCHTSSVQRHYQTAVCHTSSVQRHYQTVMCHTSSVQRHYQTVVCHTSSVQRHYQTVVCHTSSVQRHYQTKHQSMFKNSEEKCEAIKRCCFWIQKNNQYF